jgi:membrane associated rhomboid family serine protease
VWFPARYAAEAGVPRDSLDEPLAELRLAGLVRVAEWVRGVGQGYALTPEGETAAADPALADQLNRAARVAEGQVVKIEPAEPNPATAPEADESPRETDLGLNPPLVVPVLLMANALWFFVCAVVGIKWGLAPARVLKESHHDVLQRFGAVSGEWLLQGEWWRLVTCCFVHIGALHLLGNLFALAMMGPLAELLWGRGRLLVIYFVSGIAGSALAMALRPDTILAGASGAIWGIQMSLFAWLFAFRRHLPPHLVSDWFRRLFVVFILNAGVSLLPGVSWEGHLGGGIAGFVAAGLLTAARFGDRQRRISAWFLLALLPVMCVAGLAAAMDAKGMPGWQRLRQRLAAEHEARDAAERRQRLQTARDDFNSQVAPRLPELEPKLVQPLEQEANVLLMTKNRPAERVTEVRAKAEQLKATADTIVQHTSGEPTGDESVDQHIARARAFAAARAKSFEMLLAMLADSNKPADVTWKAWQAARRDADRLWAELLPPK